MDSHSTMLIISLAALLMLSAYFSATETAFSSLNRIKVKNMAVAGNEKAQLVLELSEHYDKLISTILIGNNIVNILLSAIATVLFVSRFGNIGVTLSTAVMTVLVLLFGEITPKTMAKETPEKFAMAAAPTIKACLTIFAPLNYLFSKWKKLLLKAFKISGDQTITDKELITIVEEATKEGGINEDDGDLITNAISFHNRAAMDILTPRVDLEAIPDTAEKEEVMALFKESGHSRLPVYENSIDKIIGVIHHKDFYNEVAYTDKELSSIIKPAVFIPKTLKIPNLLVRLKEKKSHLAVVLDEFGGTLGIVTMEDALEELVGEIWDEHDVVEQEYELLADNVYRIFCSADVELLTDLFHFKPDTKSATVSGWVVEEMGKIPEEGETFRFENLFVTIEKVEQLRVTEIVVEVLEDQLEDNERPDGEL